EHSCRTRPETGQPPDVDAAAEEMASVARDLARQLLSGLRDRYRRPDAEVTQEYTPPPARAGTNPVGETAIPTVPNAAAPTRPGRHRAPPAGPGEPIQEAGRAGKANAPGTAVGGPFPTAYSPTVVYPREVPGEKSKAAEEPLPPRPDAPAGPKRPNVPGYYI